MIDSSINAWLTRRMPWHGMTTYPNSWQSLLPLKPRHVFSRRPLGYILMVFPWIFWLDLDRLCLYVYSDVVCMYEYTGEKKRRRAQRTDDGDDIHVQMKNSELHRLLLSTCIYIYDEKKNEGLRLPLIVPHWYGIPLDVSAIVKVAPQATSSITPSSSDISASISKGLGNRTAWDDEANGLIPPLLRLLVLSPPSIVYINVHRQHMSGYYQCHLISKSLTFGICYVFIVVLHFDWSKTDWAT